ncbi:MAG: HNH endonuclease signature motif containing protein [Nitrospiraceae bacterium]
MKWNLLRGITPDSPKFAEFIQRIEPFFWNKVEKSRKCWIWVGARNRQGYGIVGELSFTSKLTHETLAHRVAWVIYTHQYVPDGLIIMHSCDNPPCISPFHLSVGSNADNMADKMKKGRGMWWKGRFKQ